MDDTLKFAIENGIINMNHIQEQIEMKKRKEILSKHQYQIWQGKNGKWYTYIKENNDRKLVKRSSLKSLEDMLVCLYKEENKNDFKSLYLKWRSVQDRLVSDNTVYKYDTDYRRFFENTEFEKVDITTLTEDSITIFFHDTIIKKRLTPGAFKKLYGYVNNTINKAMRDKVLNQNPMVYLTCKQFYKYCVEAERNLEERVFLPEDFNKIISLLYEQYEKKPNYIPNYAVELASLTGMRVGEIAALEWEDINYTKGYFIINKSEKYNRKTKQYYIDSTKNKRGRIFPMDKTLIDFFQNLHKVQMQYGYTSKWVFANENGRIHSPMISSCIKNKCKMAHIDIKGIHAFRRTLNSNMRCAGVSEVIAASMMGHSPEVNRKYYTFDLSSIEQKRDILTNMHEKIK